MGGQKELPDLRVFRGPEWEAVVSWKVRVEWASQIGSDSTLPFREVRTLT
jgi:hypothetical protein